MSIEPMYYSNENFNLLYSTIETYANNKKLKLPNNYKNNLFNVMELVEKNLGLVPENSNSKRQWLQKCNKQCLKLVTNQFKKKRTKSKNLRPENSNLMRAQPPITNMPSFDNSVNMGPTFDPKMPLPQSTKFSNGPMNDTEQLFTQIQNERAPVQPEIPEAFTKVTQDVADPLAVQKYEQFINQRGYEPMSSVKPNTHSMESHMSSIGSMDNSMQNHMNSIVNTMSPNPMPTQNIEEHMNNINASSNKKEVQYMKSGLTKNESLDGSYPLIQPRETNYIKRVQLLTIDSIDRDLELYPNSTNFRVQFSAESDSLKHINTYINVGGERRLFYSGAIAEEGIRAAPVLKTYKNIHSIRLILLSMPNTCNGIYNFRDEPYLLVNIEELDNTYDGTNLANNKTFAKVHQTQNTIDGYGSRFTQKKFSQLEPYERSPKLYTPSPLAALNSMTLNISTNRNDEYSVGNDKLDILSVREIALANTACMEASCSTGSLLQMLVRLERRQGMNETDMILEAINDETIYFYTTNTCYSNQWLNFDILSGDVTSLMETSGSNYKLSINNNLNGGSTPLMISSLIDKQQVMKITVAGSVGYYRFTGVVFPDQSIELRAMSGGATGTVENIQISAINKKGISSNDCCCINYRNGFKILPMATDGINSCENDQNKNPVIFNNNEINMRTVAGGWQTDGSFSYNFYGNLAANCCGSNTDLWADTLAETSKFTFPGSTTDWNGLDSVVELVNYNIENNDKCIEKYYYQTFTMIKPKNFDVTNFEAGDVFLVRKRKQLSYTFEITTIEQDRQLINSKIV